MKTRKIVFTNIGIAELLEFNVEPLKSDEVLVESEYTAVSAGTERANLMGIENIGNLTGSRPFPIIMGYCGIGYVREIGKEVKNVSVGDRVLVYFGQHAEYNIVNAEQVMKVEHDCVSSENAAFVIIAGFSLGGVRKAQIEIGESAMVMGMGILGVFALQLCRINGAVPVIAADLSAKRRSIALSLGADFAFNPADADFVSRVKEVTRNLGVNAIIEVTGQSIALKQALDCASRQGRVSLLGCTRHSDVAIDFYQQVHRPGTVLIGAHTFVRPKYESHPHYWTWQDDSRALLDLFKTNRMDISPIKPEIYSPADAPLVYNRLAENSDFPLGVLFNWKK